MTTCKTCKHARMMFNQCRAHAPSAVPLATQDSLRILGPFPPIPMDYTGCGEYSPADEAEMATLEVAQKAVTDSLKQIKEKQSLEVAQNIQAGKKAKPCRVKAGNNID